MACMIGAAHRGLAWALLGCSAVLLRSCESGNNTEDMLAAATYTGQHVSNRVTLNTDMLLKEWPGVCTPGLNSVLPASESVLLVGSSGERARMGALGLDMMMLRCVDCSFCVSKGPRSFKDSRSSPALQMAT